MAYDDGMIEALGFLLLLCSFAAGFVLGMVVLAIIIGGSS